MKRYCSIQVFVGVCMTSVIAGCSVAPVGGGGADELVLSTRPASGATDVPLGTAITITFAREAEPDSISGGLDPDIEFDVSWSSGNTVLTVTPVASLDSSTTYAVTIDELSFTDGSRLGQPFTLRFTTVGDDEGEDEPVATSGDCEPMSCPFDVPPGEFAIVCVTPEPCSTDVPVNTNVVIEFNRPIVLSRLGADILAETGQSTSLEVAQSADGRTLTVTFFEPLIDNLTYAVAILEAVDESESPLSNPGTFCFSTGPTPNCPSFPKCVQFDATDDGVPAFDEFDYERPFAVDSVSNTAIGDDPAIDPDSDAMIARFSEVFADFGGIWIGPLRDAMPVYLADAETPTVTVRLTDAFASSDTLDAPIPDHAVPDCGLDQFLVIYDVAEQVYYDFWRASRTDDGSWTAATGSSISATGSGVYPGNESGSSTGGRASGFAFATGMIWPHELAAGRIDHALVFVYPETRAGDPVPPATATDGVSTDARAIPEGALLQLDPALNLATLNLEPWERTIAEALQEYGMYLGDTGGSIGLSVLHVLSFEGNPYADLLPDSIIVEGGVLLDKLPPERFRVLASRN